ncbi:hypothetical protein ACFSSC_10450 [Corynebacterium mendelii]|uniref:Uncharacterized protein n=1 Tax=Corynebacterium mendelii TaxID=2765362 RepID=A0A939E0R8_9CORY|nr:hypothetical protein [Corynebacterium mendelii]MBN9644321.1 hypothetical protein [Corynebacterium mendelii]
MSRHDENSPLQARRLTGSFYTPPLWADYAHTTLDRVLGPRWRSENVVWDPACGTKNLTGGHDDYLQLFCSTIDPLELAVSDGINPGARCFVHDFLNSGYTAATPAAGLPRDLHKVFDDNRPLVILMNPPYGTGANHGGSSKRNIAATAVRRDMASLRLNRATHQLYAQFLWRILAITRHYRLTDVTVALFSNDRFLHGGPTWEKFMGEFTSTFTYRAGSVLNAGEFSAVAGSWAVSFTVWATRRATATPAVSATTTTGEHTYLLDVVENRAHTATTVGSRRVTAVTADNLLSAWVKKPLQREKKTILRPAQRVRLKNAVEPGAAGLPVTWPCGAIGYAHNNGDTVEHSPKYVGLYSTYFASGHGIAVTEANFDRACINFAVRKACVPPPDQMWLTGHTNHRWPGEAVTQDNGWEEFTGDCVALALCTASGSNQSALRDITWMGRSLDLDNEWFFLDAATIAAHARACGFGELAADADKAVAAGACRFVNRWLAQHRLGGQAGELIAALRDFHLQSLPMRRDRHRTHPQWSLAAWDAGFKQSWLAVGGSPGLPGPLVRAHAAVMDNVRRRAHDYGML